MIHLKIFLCLLALTSSASAWTKNGTKYTTTGARSDVQSAIDHASDGDTIYIPPGVFSWDGIVYAANNVNPALGKPVHIVGAGSAHIVARSESVVAVDGTGTKSWTIVPITNALSFPFSVGQRLRIEQTAAITNYNIGTITSYNATTGLLTMNIETAVGTGSRAPWILSNYDPDNQTIIRNIGTDRLFGLREPPTGRLTISRMQLMGSPGDAGLIYLDAYQNDGEPTQIFDCWIRYTGSGFPLRITSNRLIAFKITADASPFSSGSAWIYAGNQDGGIPSGNKDSWQTAHTMGAADITGKKNIYIEDSSFHALNNVTDWSDLSRGVIRRCYMNNSGINTHGPDTGQFGVRHFEIYDNVFFRSNNEVGSMVQQWIQIRGGTMVVTDNVMPPFPDGGGKPSIKMTMYNLGNSPGGPNPGWGSGDGNIPNYPAPRQPGSGYIDGTREDGLRKFSLPDNTVSPPRPARHDSVGPVGDLEPMYIWNNIGRLDNGPDIWQIDYSPQGVVDPDKIAGYIKINRDFYLSARPGYTKYTYPHPPRVDKDAPKNVFIRVERQ